MKLSESDRKLVEVHRAANLMRAHTIRLALANAGITAWVDGETLQSGLGELPLGWLTAPRVLAESGKADEARRIIAKLELQRSAGASPEPGSDLSCCLACGFAMSETDEVCDECGWTFIGDVV